MLNNKLLPKMFTCFTSILIRIKIYLIRQQFYLFIVKFYINVVEYLPTTKVHCRCQISGKKKKEILGTYNKKSIPRLLMIS